MEVNVYIKQRRIELGLTMSEVAKAVGVSEATVSRWESGHINDIKRSRISALAKVLQISPLVLVKENIEGRRGWEDEKIDIASPRFPVDFKKTVPVLGRIAAGSPIIANEDIEYYIGVENENIDFGLIVSGESMYPTILPSSTIFVQTDAEISSGAIVVAIVNGDEATVKRLYIYGDKVMLRPDNHNYPEQEYSADEVHVLGRVVEMRVSLV